MQSTRVSQRLFGRLGPRGLVGVSAMCQFDSSQSTDKHPQQGQKDCILDSSPTRDTDEPPEFPICALRSIFPIVVKDETVTAEDRPSGAPIKPKYNFHHAINPHEYRTIQHNKCADRNVTQHRIEWHYLDIDPLEPPGDIIGDDERSAADPSNDIIDEDGRESRARGGRFVRQLKLGDVVTLWAMARFPGWTNYIEHARVDVYWSL